MSTELALLQRAHDLFAGTPAPAGLPGADTRPARRPPAEVGVRGYRPEATRAQAELIAGWRTDDAVRAVLTRALRDHAAAEAATRAVLDEARADAPAETALAQREALRRRAARLRAQHRHVVTAQRRARRHAAALRALTYRTRHRGVPRAPGRRAPGRRAAVAVRAALSRLGRPYVWGASGPASFDCSGLTQWSYAQAGIHLHRTTYQQLHDGIPVSRAQIRPGDLVFPNPGHVQLAIGHGRVVEASHPGAPVRIAPLGPGVQIRRPG